MIDFYDNIRMFPMMPSYKIEQMVPLYIRTEIWLRNIKTTDFKYPSHKYMQNK